MIHRPVLFKFLLKLIGGPRPWRKSAFPTKLPKRSAVK